jgi:hypothetical protein
VGQTTADLGTGGVRRGGVAEREGHQAADACGFLQDGPHPLVGGEGGLFADPELHEAGRGVCEERHEVTLGGTN